MCVQVPAYLIYLPVKQLTSSDLLIEVLGVFQQNTIDFIKK